MEDCWEFYKFYNSAGDINSKLWVKEFQLLQKQISGHNTNLVGSLAFLRMTLLLEYISMVVIINPIQDGLFRGCSGMGRGGAKRPPSLKSVTYILQRWNLAQLYLSQRRSRKYMNHVTHPLSSADISIFLPEISRFCYIKKYRYRLYFDI